MAKYKKKRQVGKPSEYGREIETLKRMLDSGFEGLDVWQKRRVMELIHCLYPEAFERFKQ